MCSVVCLVSCLFFSLTDYLSFSLVRLGVAICPSNSSHFWQATRPFSYSCRDLRYCNVTATYFTVLLFTRVGFLKSTFWTFHNKKKVTSTLERWSINGTWICTHTNPSIGKHLWWILFIHFIYTGVSYTHLLFSIRHTQSVMKTVFS